MQVAGFAGVFHWVAFGLGTPRGSVSVGYCFWFPFFWWWLGGLMAQVESSGIWMGGYLCQVFKEVQRCLEAPKSPKRVSIFWVMYAHFLYTFFLEKT